MKIESQKYRYMNKLETSSHNFRKARTRSLIALGGIVAKSGLLETFQLTLGDDFQRSEETKEPIAALFKGLLVLNEMAQSEDMHLSLWANQGLEAFARLQQEKSMNEK